MSYHGDTLIHIDIQAPNGHEVRDLVMETFKFMPPWKMVASAFHAPSDARFFAFNLTVRDFVWLRSNDSYDDTMDEENTFVVHSVADMSWLLEFVELNSLSLRGPLGLNLDKIKQKLEEFEKQPKKRKKFKVYGPPPTDKELMDALVAIQPMNEPSGKIFYMDYVNTWNGPSKSDVAGEVIAKLKAEATKSGKAIITATQKKAPKLKANWIAEDQQPLMSEEMLSQMAEQVKGEIDAEILAQLLKTVEASSATKAEAAYPWWNASSWGAKAEMEYAKSQHAKEMAAKYAKKAVNPSFYGKIVIPAVNVPFVPMDL